MQNSETMLSNHKLKNHSNTTYDALLLKHSMLGDDPLGEPFPEHEFQALSPATNIEEYENKFVMLMVMPGLEKKDIAIHVKNNQITVQVEKKVPVKHQKMRNLLQEFNFLILYRSFLLPDELQLDNITASYADGILEIILPKFETGTHFPAQNIPIR
ncbi:MAG: hypothetical protein RL607_2192 [Bacteroidota bacterium]|jgi:HSP20 family protein